MFDGAIRDFKGMLPINIMVLCLSLLACSFIVCVYVCVCVLVFVCGLRVYIEVYICIFIYVYLRQSATNHKVAGSTSYDVIELFH